MTKGWVTAGVLVGLAIVAVPGRSQAEPAFKGEKSRHTSEQVRAHVNLALEKMGAGLDSLISGLVVQEAADIAGLVAQEAVEAAQEVEQEIILGDSERGWLGVNIGEVTAEKAKELKPPAVRGVLLTEVESDSPAAKAGLKVNDIVTEYNGQHVEGAVQFRRLVRETPAGHTVQLTVWREGRSQNVSVELGKFRSRMAHSHAFGPEDFHFNFRMPEINGYLSGSRTPMLGITAEDLSGQLGAYFGAPDGEGVLVSAVRSGTGAEKAGLKAGDVITKINGERVRNVGELREKLRAKRDAKSAAVTVIRKGAEMSLNVELEQPRPPAERRIMSRRIVI